MSQVISKGTILYVISQLGEVTIAVGVGVGVLVGVGVGVGVLVGVGVGVGDIGFNDSNNT
jgi:hypothetical protein